MALNYILLGKRIQTIRKKKGLSQAKLSEIIDKTPTYVSYIELYFIYKVIFWYGG